MNHLKTYLKLIRKAESRNWTRATAEVYVEKHHVFPKCIWGENSRVVCLTAREHFLAHALLAKAARKRWGLNNREVWGLVTAYSQMGAGVHKLPNRINTMSSRLIADGRRMFKETHSLRHSGKNNPTYGFEWRTDGTSNFFGHPSKAPLGWRRGKISMKPIPNFRWYNNGNQEVKITENQLIPEGFHPGRISQPNRKPRKPLKWITDGSCSKRVPKDQTIPLGWRPGRLKK